MGFYVNPGNGAFQEAVNSMIFVDKSKLISYTNSILNTTHKYLCVSRPRHFGKSMAVEMLVAYYSKGCDSSHLFAGRNISREQSFQSHLNQHHVLRFDVQQFLFRESDLESFIDEIQVAIIKELRAEYRQCFEAAAVKLPDVLRQIYAHTKRDLFSSLMNGIQCFGWRRSIKKHRRNT